MQRLWVWPTEDEGCQLFSKFFNNMDYIIIENLFCNIQVQFFQMVATLRNKADCFPIYSMLKKNISFDFNKRALVVVLISRYYNAVS